MRKFLEFLWFNVVCIKLGFGVIIVLILGDLGRIWIDGWYLVLFCRSLVMILFYSESVLDVVGLFGL